jgi:hypothetical protein
MPSGASTRYTSSKKRTRIDPALWRKRPVARRRSPHPLPPQILYTEPHSARTSRPPECQGIGGEDIRPFEFCHNA